MKKLLILLPLSVILMGFACQSSDPMKTATAARDSLAASKGALLTAHEKYDTQCIPAPTASPCPVIHKASAAQNTLTDALNMFCNGNANPGELSYANGGSCHPDASLQPKLQSATTDLNQIISDVKGLIQ